MSTGSIGAALSVILASVPAGAAIVTFDEIGTQPSLFSNASPLRDEYAGLLFSGPGPLDGGAVLDVDGGFGIAARSGRNFLAYNRNSFAIMKNGGRAIDPQTIEFLASPASSVEIYCFGRGVAFTMEGFNSSGASVASSNIGSADTGWTKLSISAPSISRITLSETGGASNGAWVFDDLSYTPVPAPAGVAVLGLGGLLGVRRRR